MGDRDGWLRGRSWWDERLREIRQSSPYRQRSEAETDAPQPRSRRSRQSGGPRRTASRSPPPSEAGESRATKSPTPGGSARTKSKSPDGPQGQPARAISPKTKLLLQHQASPSTANGWDSERVKRDSQAWNEMLNSTAENHELNLPSYSETQNTPEKLHVRAVLNKLQAGWLAVRKVLATQARTSGATPVDDFSIGFDDLASAIEMAGVSVTRMQLSALFTLMDTDKCGIVTLVRVRACPRLRPSAMDAQLLEEPCLPLPVVLTLPTVAPPCHRVSSSPTCGAKACA